MLRNVKKQNKLFTSDTVIVLEKQVPLLRKSKITQKTSAAIIKES